MHSLSRLQPGVTKSALLVGIAECVRAEYPVPDEPLPERLAALVKELERPQVDRGASKETLPRQPASVMGYPFPGIARKRA